MQLTDLSAKDAATFLADTIEAALIKLPRAERMSRLAAIGRALERYRRETGLDNEYDEQAIQDPTMRRRASRRTHLWKRHEDSWGEASGS